MCRRPTAQIVADFAAIPKREKETVKVGIVGEIFVKYSPLGNNNLEQFLVDEGAEVVMPGLLDFCLYCVYNQHDGLQAVRQQAAFVPRCEVCLLIFSAKRSGR